MDWGGGTSSDRIHCPLFNEMAYRVNHVTVRCYNKPNRSGYCLACVEEQQGLARLFVLRNQGSNALVVDDITIFRAIQFIVFGAQAMNLGLQACHFRGNNIQAIRANLKAFVSLHDCLRLIVDRVRYMAGKRTMRVSLRSLPHHTPHPYSDHAHRSCMKSLSRFISMITATWLCNPSRESHTGRL